jgi:hypothetical protein
MDDYEINVKHLLQRASSVLGEMHLKVLMLECRATEAEAERDALKAELARLKEEASHDGDTAVARAAYV